jgi:hypothetical protein
MAAFTDEAAEACPMTLLRETGNSSLHAVVEYSERVSMRNRYLSGRKCSKYSTLRLIQFFSNHVVKRILDSD